MMNKNIKKDFPLLRRLKKRGHFFVYLDSAATSQKPRAVISAETRWYESLNANVHRGIYRLAEDATREYEAVRKKTAQFIGAKSATNIVFTKGATEGINLVASSFVAENLKRGDVILITEMEHHANLVPWQLLSRERGFHLRYWPITPEGKLVMVGLAKILARVKFLSLCHVSNVLGTVNPIKRIIEEAHSRGIPVLVDAAQSVPHMPFSTRHLRPDFLVFSSHKMLGPTGVGVLYVDEKHYDKMRPYQAGGEMIESVGYDVSTFKHGPWKFEAGTQPLAQVYAFGVAIDYLRAIGMKNIWEHQKELVTYAYMKLSSIPEVKIFGPQPHDRCGLISFTVAGIHSHDLATFLDVYGLAIRAGHHCAQPIHNKFKTESTARISFHIYNSVEDVDYFIKILRQVIHQWQRSIGIS